MFERTKKWYKQLKDDPLKNIVHASCIVPFLNIQQAGYEMFQTLAEQPWGQEEINKCSSKYNKYLHINLLFLTF